MKLNKLNEIFVKYKLFICIYLIFYIVWIRFFNFVIIWIYFWGKRESWEVKEWRYKLEGFEIYSE